MCDYASLGHHRSGTDRDLATAQWFADLVGDLGTVTTTVVEFERYDARSELLVDGRVLDRLALYYEFLGDVDTTDVAIRRLDPRSRGFSRVADETICEAKEAGYAALVIATEHPSGDLVAINRDLAALPSGLPTLLVAGRHYDALASASVRLKLHARLVPGRTANIEVSNDQPGPQLVLTTPLNGWFGAAGERSTGIAVLRHVAERLADRSVAIVATGGHELGYLGAHAWIDRCIEAPACVAHLGASLAVEASSSEGSRQLIDSRIAMTTLDEATARPVGAALRDAGIGLRCRVDSWLGEGEAWSRLGVPVLSTTGAGPDFHTLSDTPERATSPAAGEHAQTISETIKRDYGPVEHPLVRTHPETGKRALLYAEQFIDHVAGVSRAESDMVLNFVRQHVADVSLHCRWQWQEGDLAIWDERSTLHRAAADHFPQRRIIRRLEIDGDRPYFDPNGS